jgi:hypothetical protein
VTEEYVEKPKTLEELRAELAAAQTMADRARLARLITARRAEEDDAKRQELLDECAYLECSLREQHGLSAVQVIGLCSYESLVANGHGLIVVREIQEESRRAAVNAMHRVDDTNSAGIFSSEPAVVTKALLKCCLYPDPSTPEGTLKIQQLVRDAFPFAHAAYKRACVMSGMLATEASAK